MSSKNSTDLSPGLKNGQFLHRAGTLAVQRRRVLAVLELCEGRYEELVNSSKVVQVAGHPAADPAAADLSAINETVPMIL